MKKKETCREEGEMYTCTGSRRGDKRAEGREVREVKEKFFLSMKTLYFFLFSGKISFPIDILEKHVL